MNQFNGVGNLVADVELKGQNNNVANFRVAIQRPFKTSRLTNTKQIS
jgi:single-strand DNA-binding protein